MASDIIEHWKASAY